MDVAAWIVCFLITYLIFVALLFYTLLLGGSPRHERSIIGRAHVFLTSTLCTYSFRAIGSLCCRRAQDPALKAEEACITAKNSFERYVMPLIYIMLLVSGLAAAKTLIVPRLAELAELAPSGSDCSRTKLICIGVPGATITVPPRTNPDAIWFYAALSFGSWLAVFLANPGIVTADNHDLMSKLYDYDNFIFPSGKECKTCRHTKLPRTKHDKLLNVCVMRYDHYCGWTGNVVGLYNTNRFLFFLLVHLTMLVHGMLLSAEIVYARVLEFIDASYVYIPTNTVITTFNPVVAFAAEPSLCLFFFVIALFVCVVGGFFIYHLYLVVNNTTTSETFKWAPIHEACKEFIQDNGFSYGHKLHREAEAEARQNGSDTLPALPSFYDNGLPVNIYDRGIVENVFEVLFPNTFVASAAGRNDVTARTKQE